MTNPGRWPQPGEVLYVGRAASPQFAAGALLFRVIRVHDWPTYDGWAWILGYALDAKGKAVERREIYVKVAGLRRAYRRTT